MGLLQRALETYESHIAYTENREGVTPMAPVGHIVTGTDLEITLDEEGNFLLAASVASEDSKVIIPVTENSAGRSNSPSPHPLCEQLGYLIPQNASKYELYVEKLSAWASSEYSHPKLIPVLNYVRGGSILADLLKCGLIKTDAKGIPKKENLMVRWRIRGANIEECWRDSSLIEAFKRYYLSDGTAKTGRCIATGEYTRIGKNHQKGVVPSFGNAKIISFNDKQNFTYRGRFTEPWQAAEIGYVASAKAHNALRWLVQEKGVTAQFGGRVFLCWNPKGKTIIHPTLPCRKEKPVWSPNDYNRDLQKILDGKRKEFEITDGVVVAALDAAGANSGRLSITYYNEFMAYDFFERLGKWDEFCCWRDDQFGIQTPLLYNIANYAFGTLKKEKREEKIYISTDDRVLREQMQRLVVCRLGNAPMGLDIVKLLANKVVQISGKQSDKELRDKVLFTACAVIRKYRHDRLKEEWSMALESKKKNRSYQFGRLLAIMEKVERNTYEKDEDREPNAIRLHSVFCKRPMHTAGNIEDKLESAYYPRLDPQERDRYKGIVSQIMEIISEFPQDSWNDPLDETYLMGYYLQRSALYAKQDKNMEGKINGNAEK